MRPGSLHFQCNICHKNCVVDLSVLHREVISCQTCGSTPRTRAIIRALSLELFNRVLLLPDFPERRDIKGIGMTDSEGYASVLAKKFSYENTYLHKEPRVDVAGDITRERLGVSDFIISSEVFEHVVPPIDRAFENVYRMLKPGGVFILTVPYGLFPETIEHFPDLNEYEILEEKGSYKLRNVIRDGKIQEFKDLVFHGGPGSTLEMRIFGEKSLLLHLERVGFEEIKVHRAPDFIHGIWWPEPWSFPISAKKP